MKKIAIMIMAFLCTNSVIQAQGISTTNIEELSDSNGYYTQLDDSPVDSPENRIEILLQRVDSLEKELSFVKLAYELKILKNELDICANNINIKSNSILININSRTYLHSLYNAYKESYESCESLIQAYQVNIEIRKKNCWVHISKISSIKQIMALKSSLDMIDKTYKSLKAALDYYKVCLDLYKDYIKDQQQS